MFLPPDEEPDFMNAYERAESNFDEAIRAIGDERKVVEVLVAATKLAKAAALASPSPSVPEGQSQADAHAAEIEQWRKFAQHCQRTVAAIKSHLTTEQVLKFLGEDMRAAIDRLATSDTSDIDPDLRAYAERVLGERNGRLNRAALQQPEGV